MRTLAVGEDPRYVPFGTLPWGWPEMLDTDRYESPGMAGGLLSEPLALQSELKDLDFEKAGHIEDKEIMEKLGPLFAKGNEQRKAIQQEMNEIQLKLGVKTEQRAGQRKNAAFDQSSLQQDSATEKHEKRQHRKHQQHGADHSRVDARVTRRLITPPPARAGARKLQIFKVEVFVIWF